MFFRYQTKVSSFVTRFVSTLPRQHTVGDLTEVFAKSVAPDVGAQEGASAVTTVKNHPPQKKDSDNDQDAT